MLVFTTRFTRPAPPITITIISTSHPQDSIFGMVACVLALGNIKFSGGSKASVGSDKYLETAAKLLQVDAARLKVAFTVREIRIRGMATTKVNLNEKDAGDTRHALAKFLYSKMFDWIVQKVNQAMGKGATKGLRIGILDIFGFEIFKHNSFEQLCINYTNEMLQQHFNNNTFKLEEQMYKPSSSVHLARSFSSHPN